MPVDVMPPKSTDELKIYLRNSWKKASWKTVEHSQSYNLWPSKYHSLLEGYTKKSITMFVLFLHSSFKHPLLAIATERS